MNGMDNLVAIGTAMFFLGIVGAFVGSTRGQTVAGFLLGVLLGPIGWLLVMLMDPSPEVKARKIHEQAQAMALAQHYVAHPPSTPVPAGWQPDPMGRHAQRWWNGTEWTQDVADAKGAMSADPIA